MTFARSSSVSAPRDQRVNVCFRQRLEPQRDWPLRAALGQLWPGEAEDEDRRAGGEQGDVLDEVEERLLSPVNVVEDADERFSLRLLFEQLAERPGDLLGRGALLSLPEQGAERGRCCRVGGERIQLFQHLHHRPVGDPLPVGETAATHDLGIDVAQELVGEPGLADTRRSQHGKKLAGAIALGPSEGVAQRLQLALASDHRNVMAPRRLSPDGDEPEGRNRLRLPLQLQRLERLCLHDLPHERERSFADQDLARLQPPAPGERPR